MRSAVEQALARMYHKEPYLCSRYRNIGESAFLLQLGFIYCRLLTREKPLLHPGEKYYRKFQSLCTVHRHQCDGISLAVIIIDIGDERYFLEKARETDFLFLVRFLIFNYI